MFSYSLPYVSFSRFYPPKYVFIPLNFHNYVNKIVYTFFKLSVGYVMLSSLSFF